MSREQYEPLAVAAAKKYGVPVDLYLRLVTQESGWNPNAISPAGAEGIVQFMPGTAKDMGINPRDAGQALDAGARYLRQQYDEFGDWGLGLAAYNAGPGAVRKYGGIPPFAETQAYVAKIHGGGGTENALSAYSQPSPGADLNALAALLDRTPEKPEIPELRGYLDPAMFMNKRSFG